MSPANDPASISISSFRGKMRTVTELLPFPLWPADISPVGKRPRQDCSANHCAAFHPPPVRVNRTSCADALGRDKDLVTPMGIRKEQEPRSRQAPQTSDTKPSLNLNSLGLEKTTVFREFNGFIALNR